MSGRSIQKIGLPVSRRNLLSSGSLLLAGGALSLAGCARGTSTHAGRKARQPIDAQPLAYNARDGFEKLNRLRRKHWLPEFVMDERLQKAAEDYANLMGERGLYGHEIGPGTDFKTRIFSVGFDNSAGENIGVGYRSVEEALQGWMDSPPHRKNMLKRRYNAAGLAYGFNTSGRNLRYTHFWVLIMGRA